MDEIEVIAKGEARKLGCRWLAEDIAQEARLQRHLGRKASVGQIAIDVVRSEFGRSGTDTNAAKRAERVGWLPVEDAMRIGEPEMEDGLQWQSVVASLKDEERAFVVLFYQWGLTLKEIAFCYGVTESRVCQQLGEATNKLRKRRIVSLE